MKPLDTGSIIVRKARKEDAAQLSSLARELLLYEKSLNKEMGEIKPWAANVAEMRKQLMRPDTWFFVAEGDGGIVGYIKLVIHGTHPDRHEIGTTPWLINSFEHIVRKVFDKIARRPRSNVETVGGYISGIFVKAEMRRLAVGRRLVDAAEIWLRSHGVAICELYVLVDNEGARQFWQDLGYEPLTIGMRRKMIGEDS